MSKFTYVVTITDGEAAGLDGITSVSGWGHAKNTCKAKTAISSPNHVCTDGDSRHRITQKVESMGGGGTVEIVKVDAIRIPTDAVAVDLDSFVDALNEATGADA